MRLILSVTLLSLVSVSSAYAQREMYPEKMGTQHKFEYDPLPRWVTFDMELRGRTEEQTSLGYVSGKDRLYELTRIRGGVTVRPVSWLTGYLQFQDAHALGLPLRDLASNMRDTFDLRQGYLDFHSRSVQLVAGRQELRFGDERVVGVSDWTNTGRTWDGFKLRIGAKNNVELFSTSVVLVRPGSYDTHGAGLTFHGAVGTMKSLLPKTTLQPFVLVKAEPRVKSRQNIYGTETEVTTGIFWDSKLPHGFDTSGTVDLQRGSYSNDSIHAGAAILRAGWSFASIPGKPHLQGEYDYATGYSGTNPLRIGTYDQQYPSSHNAFGEVDLFGFQNIKQNRLSLTLSPRKNILVLFQVGSLHLASTHDGVYTGSASKLFGPPSSGFTHDGIGTEFDASAKHVWSDSFVTNIGVGHLFPGYVMTSSNHGAPLTVAFVQLTYRFKVDKGSENHFEIDRKHPRD
ncbi:alginate export family protein [Edaphobacter aggregans]|uniref:alginate export family protein n=1 Tax=Edaphobacter aggregans TaxID=570835 RepID=UPI0006913DF5|nr:alginate export family protein [Edaphobacter aggregans]